MRTTSTTTSASSNTMSLLSYLRRVYLYWKIKLYFLPGDFIYPPLIRRARAAMDLSNVTALTIPGSGGKGQLRLFLHTPPNTSCDTPKPVHVNWHGPSGFRVHAFGMNARFCQLICKEADCYVVDADYRKTPDHPFPDPYDDAICVLKWVRANERGLFDTARITIGGFSAGAKLALAVTATSEPEVVKGVTAFYPVVDDTIPFRDLPAPAVTKLPMDKGAIIPVQEAEMYRQGFLLGLPHPMPRVMLEDPRISPRFAPPHCFPDKHRTMLLTCEYDPWGFPTKRMAETLEKEGRELVQVEVQGLGHGWDGMCRDGTAEAKVRDEMWAKAVEVVRRAQGKDA